MDRTSALYLIVIAASASLFYLSAKDATEFDADCMAAGRGLLQKLANRQPLPVQITQDDSRLAEILSAFKPANSFEVRLTSAIATKKFLLGFLHKCSAAVKEVTKNCDVSFPISMMLDDYLSRGAETKFSINDVQTTDLIRNFKDHLIHCDKLAHHP